MLLGLIVGPIIIKNPISDILQLNISKKYRKLSLDEDYNKNIYNKVIDLSDWLKKLFDMNYLDAFKLYYNRCQPLECFEFEDKIIKFSNFIEIYNYFKGIIHYSVDNSFFLIF